MTMTWTWIGGGNNEWNNPADWQPNGVPRPGDTLIINNNGSINFSDGAIETLQINSTADISMGSGNILAIDSTTSPRTDIDVNGSGNILHTDITGGAANINLAPGGEALVTGSIKVADFLAPISAPGGQRGTLIDGGATIKGAFVGLNADVLGTGTIEFVNWNTVGGPIAGGSGDVAGPSGPGITYKIDSSSQSIGVTVQDPSTFQSKIEIGDRDVVYLQGMDASSYDIRGDLLTLYQGNNPICSLRVADAGTAPIAVSGNAYYVEVGVSSPAQVTSDPYNPPLLPMHHVGV